ncbi:YceI family protein [Haloechinothrix halophila]|uniref:YceI family protein n=1 Tax=Haloechinothrix halophila TaxID=1069073 RepID=UPI000412B83A|nr:YceI family protein [Haloechinothrix halophila]
MTPLIGQFSLGPPSARLFVRTSRTGLGARAGQDLTIEVTRWEAQVSVPEPDVTTSSVSVAADTASFEVREGAGGVLPLSDADRTEIERTIRDKILFPDVYPAITFTSTAVRGSGDGIEIDGDLTIMAVTQPLTTYVRLGDDGFVRGRAAVTQTEWGIKPYSALFGALRLADEVAVEIEGALGG